MPKDKSYDLTDAVRKVLEENSTQWLDLPPADGGELIAIVYSRRDSTALLVYHMSNGTFVAQRYKDIDAEKVASTLVEMVDSRRKVFSTKQRIINRLLSGPQILIARYKTSTKFAYSAQPKPPLPMEPPS